MAKESIKTVGIDFGTTNTLVAYYDDYGKIDFLEDERLSSPQIPTLICCESIDEKEKPSFIFGGEARDRAEKNPESLIKEFKRKIGSDEEIAFSSLSDPSKRIALSVEEIVTFFFSWLFQQLQKKMACEQIHAVVTYPCAFSPNQCELIKRAAKNGGFAQVRLYKEPVAAAVAYGMDKQESCNILVYDFGGGTLDLALVRKENSTKEEGTKSFIELSSSGNPNFGGTDITAAFQELLYKRLERNHGLSMWSPEDSNLEKAEYRANELEINEAAESIKCGLSSSKNVPYELSFLYHRDENKNQLEPVSVQDEVSRSQFPKEADVRIHKETKKLIDEVLKDKKIDDIQVVIMSGGSSNLLRAQETVHELVCGADQKIEDPGTMIARGALILSQDPSIKTIQKMPMDLGIHSGMNWDFDPLIFNGEELPCSAGYDYYLEADNPGYVKLDFYTRLPNNHSAKVFRCQFADRVEILLPAERINLRDFRNKIHIEVTVSSENEIFLSAEVRDFQGNTIFQKNDIQIRRESVR